MRYLLLLLSFAVSSAIAKAPTELFGVKLGAAYEFNIMIDEESNQILSVTTSAPVEKIVGVRNFFGNGFTFHFKPFGADKSFPYLEYQRKNVSERSDFVQSSFSFTAIFSVQHGIPQIPFNKKMMMEVVSIGWNDDIYSKLSEKEKFDRTIDNCAAFEARYGLPNETLNSNPFYLCSFWGANESELRVRTATPMGTDLYISKENLAKKVEGVVSIRNAWENTP